MPVLIVATILENLCGPAFAIDNIYHSAWFIALWALLATTGIAYIVRTKRRGSLILLHASLAMVLLGALVTFLTARHGDITLAKDGAPASMFEMRDGTLQKLPFRLQLVDIDTIYSKNGTQSDYRAHITADDRMERSVEYTASLNSPMKIKDYSFCIKGMSDGNLSLLAAHDPFGRPISYTGYLMVCISFLLLFFDKKSGFNTLLYKLKGESGKRKGRLYQLSVFRSHLSSFTFYLSALIVLPVSFMFLCILWHGRGVFPATNGSEALMLLAVFVALLAVALRSKKEFALLRRVLVVVASGIAVAAGVCGFDGNGDVQPILRTPLLGIHVTTIIIAYALLACTAVNAVIALCTKDERKSERQALLGRLLLYPATMLLAGGIFIGAVWANISWGRYWGWDPKEVWALITLLVCSIGFHAQSLPFIARPKAFHIFCIVAFAAVLFTFFGVNWLLGGLHSYM